MERIEERYISLLTDFGFKRIFGTSLNADLLINFLNSLFDGRQVITSVKHLNSEHIGDISAERKAIFDVYCENEKGEKFIVEMQNAYQKFFKDRSIFYSTYPIREQAPKNSMWDFKLDHVYTVALLNFDLKDPAFDEEQIKHEVKLCDTYTHQVFYDKLDFIYVEIAKFNKQEDELETIYDKWLYVLKNLPVLDKRPQALREKIFDRLFEQAEVAKFNKSELKAYEDSVKAYRDIKNSIDTAREEGREAGRAEGLAEGHEKGLIEGHERGLAEGHEKGRTEGILQTARKLKAMGLSTADIKEATGLSEEDIERL